MGSTGFGATCVPIPCTTRLNLSNETLAIGLSTVWPLNLVTIPEGAGALVAQDTVAGDEFVQSFAAPYTRRAGIGASHLRDTGPWLAFTADPGAIGTRLWAAGVVHA